MAGTTSDKLALLRQIKEAFRVAITGKGQTISNDEPFSAWPAKVTAIQTGVDTSDATATASDIASGATAYVNGEKITGNIETYDSGTGLVVNAQSRNKSGSNLATMVTNSSDSLLRSGSTIMINDPLTNFGDATAADVAYGKTFTSSTGLKVAGTLNEIKSGQGIAADGSTYLGYGTEWIIGASYQFSSDSIYRAGSTLSIGVPASEFGDATADDVAYGKTFTSSAGLKVTGKAKRN